jgi:FMN phosphatase YigB (HAD superfamily)
VGPRAWLEELAASYRDLVDGFVGAEDAGVYKPHPGIYRHLLAQAGTEPPAAPQQPSYGSLLRVTDP